MTIAIRTPASPSAPALQMRLTDSYFTHPRLTTCVVCGQRSWLEQLVTVDGSNHPICFHCFGALEQVRQFLHHRPLLIDDEQESVVGLD